MAKKLLRLIRKWLHNYLKFKIQLTDVFFFTISRRLIIIIIHITDYMRQHLIKLYDHI